MTSKHPEKGQRIVAITPEFLEDVLVHGSRVRTDLPQDARLTSLWVDDRGWTYYCLFESDAWEPMTEGETIPKLDVAVERAVVDER